MNKRTRTIRYVLDTLIALPALAVYHTVRFMPETTTVRFGRFLGSVSWFFRVRYRVLNKNLSIAFPTVSDRERKTLIRKVHVNFGRFFTEWFVMPKCWLTMKKRVRCVGIEELHDALQTGRGVIICSAHFGNWEILASTVSACINTPLRIIRNRLKNRRLDRWFSDIHHMMGYKDIMRDQSALRIFRSLRNNEIIGMLVDQNGRRDGIWLPFFDRATSFRRGPGIIASKTGCAIVTAFCFPLQDGTWEIRFSRLKTALTGDIETDTDTVMRFFALQLESAIRLQPDWYFWFHRRWKTKIPEAVRKQWDGS
jgi:Kdo2-lipid IVA lauroyltransferase/acyltransferase